MKYEKKIIILGEVDGGFARSQVKATLTIERKDALRCSLQVFNLKDINSGEYLLGITLKDARTEIKNLGRSGRISTLFEISPQNELDGSIRAVLVYSDSFGKMMPIAYGCNDNKRVWQGNMLDGFIRKQEFFSDEKSMQSIKSDPKAENLEQGEEFEAIAWQREQEKEAKGQKEKEHRERENERARQEEFKARARAKEIERRRKEEDIAPEDEKNEEQENIAIDDLQGQGLTYNDYYRFKSNDLAENAKQRQMNEQNIGKEEFYEKKAKGKSSPPFMDIVSSYEDNALADANYYPEGFGLGLKEAGFTLSSSLMPRARRSPFSRRQVEGQSFEQKEEPKDQLYVRKTAARYYEQIGGQIEELFKKFPPAADINALLPDTRWVKVDYDGNGKYYVIGLIGSEPSYIAYGVPAKYSALPPPELEGYCQWFPLDARKPQEDGYWLMYQDASSGENVAVEIV